ncbi:LysR family transcriptional regulator [Oceanibacterium hippocampi]|nr:LysR family transcriptional regulator [Oceanibacterium hippocampi]
MRLLTTAVEAGSFSAAGRQLGLAPSSVSRQINGLEDKLGVRLLNRSTRKLSLTEAGLIYYQRAKQVLADIEEANLAVTKLGASPTGSLRVTAPVAFGRLHIAPAIPEFVARHPEVSVDLILTDNIIDLIEAGIDLAVRIAELKDSSLIARKLANNNRVVCGSPDYFRKHGVPTTPTELERHNCLLYKQTGHQDTWRFRCEDGMKEIRVSGNLQCNNAEALLAAALNGLGIVLLSSWMVQSDIASGRLVQILPDYTASPSALDTAIYAVFSHNRHLSPKVRAFVDFLVERYASRTEWDIPPVVRPGLVEAS